MPYVRIARGAKPERCVPHACRCIEQGVTFLSEKVDYVDHGETGTEESSKVVTVDGRELYARAVLDATGHARRLVEFEEEFTPGYQVNSTRIGPPEDSFGAQPSHRITIE